MVSIAIARLDGAALRDPGWIAQAIGAAVALYGAYKGKRDSDRQKSAIKKQEAQDKAYAAYLQQQQTGTGATAIFPAGITQQLAANPALILVGIAIVGSLIVSRRRK